MKREIGLRVFKARRVRRDPEPLLLRQLADTEDKRVQDDNFAV